MERHMNNFDYTEWQRAYFDAMTTDEIKQDIDAFVKKKPFQGNAVRLSHRLRPEDPDPIANHF